MQLPQLDVSLHDRRPSGDHVRPELIPQRTSLEWPAVVAEQLAEVQVRAGLSRLSPEWRENSRKPCICRNKILSCKGAQSTRTSSSTSGQRKPPPRNALSSGSTAIEVQGRQAEEAAPEGNDIPESQLNRSPRESSPNGSTSSKLSSGVEGL
ncbi:hypothetical protein PLESTB_001759600 [Pleodorina starrii]|uniref:Uncharacterized protein n=1 Tax=Pleodorina starrii TaxID=330485 RepID=A0A9W6F9L7_9CHLO|nr:hypothetical protein PLESTM_000601100 [Pleodorina starrii]GLC61469.1 hypothetical protein PLESTB_001759600 [Pleodorina starrii]GLC74109.1 hypothetical protein PLESTF_001460700 [Pleodorina starrii]